jgi:hypothetical protein
MFSTVKIGDGVAMKMNHFGCKKIQVRIKKGSQMKKQLVLKEDIINKLQLLRV